MAFLKYLYFQSYLFLRGLHDRNEVLEARREVLDYISSTGPEKLDNVTDGILNHQCTIGCVPFMEVSSVM